METFKENGSYNKTNWELGDIITTERLNKIEDALYEINDTAVEASKIDLSGYATKEEIPTIPTEISAFNNDAGYVTQNHIHNDYATKEEIPTVPTYVSDFINDAGYVTQYHTHNNYALKTEIPTIPTNVSVFNNDAGYLTEHQSLADYATKTELNDAIANIEPDDIDLTNYATKSYVDNAIAAGVEVTYTGVRIEIVNEYPETEEENVLYIKVSE